MSQALSQSSPSTSMSIRMSSGMPIAGWVSFSWIATLSGNSSKSYGPSLAADDILQRRGDEEILLLEPQLPPLSSSLG